MKPRKNNNNLKFIVNLKCQQILQLQTPFGIYYYINIYKKKKTCIETKCTVYLFLKYYNQTFRLFKPDRKKKTIFFKICIVNFFYLHK